MARLILRYVQPEYPYIEPNKKIASQQKKDDTISTLLTLVTTSKLVVSIIASGSLSIPLAILWFAGFTITQASFFVENNKKRKKIDEREQKYYSLLYQISQNGIVISYENLTKIPKFETYWSALNHNLYNMLPNKFEIEIGNIYGKQIILELLRDELISLLQPIIDSNHKFNLQQNNNIIFHRNNIDARYYMNYNGILPPTEVDPHKDQAIPIYTQFKDSNFLLKPIYVAVEPQSQSRFPTHPKWITPLNNGRFSANPTTNNFFGKHAYIKECNKYDVLGFSLTFLNITLAAISMGLSIISSQLRADKAKTFNPDNAGDASVATAIAAFIVVAIVATLAPIEQHFKRKRLRSGGDSSGNDGGDNSDASLKVAYTLLTKVGLLAGRKLQQTEYYYQGNGKIVTNHSELIKHLDL